jgi:hypothetical protein
MQPEAHSALDKQRLGQMTDMISNVKVGDQASPAFRVIDSDQIAQGDTFHNDRHRDLKADFILAKPPFNITDWGGERLRDAKRWQYGAAMMDCQSPHSARRTGSLR